jgi:hypothetical protein
MELTLKLPVLFTAPSSTGATTRTYLAHVSTVFEIDAIPASAAPVAATVEKPSNDTMITYRLHGDRLYCRYRYRAHVVDAPGYAAMEMDVSLARSTAAALGKVSGGVSPLDAREHLNRFSEKLSQWSHKTHAAYQEQASSIENSKDIARAISMSPDFTDAYERVRRQAEKELTKYAMVGDEVYVASRGLAIRVDIGKAERVGVSFWPLISTKAWDGTLATLGAPLDRPIFRFFGVDLQAEAMAFAEKVGHETGRPVVVENEEQPMFAVPLEDFPAIDWRYAELVRAAKNACKAVGVAIGVRLKAEGQPILTDDPHIRYAFDALARALTTVDPFSGVDNGVEAASHDLLDAVYADISSADTVYDGLVSRWASAFDFLRESLDNWSERRLVIDIPPTAHP